MQIWVDADACPGVIKEIPSAPAAPNPVPGPVFAGFAAAAYNV